MLISSDYPYVQVQITIRTYRSVFRALVDTGFDGHVILPESLGEQLGKPDYLSKSWLADSTERDTPEYQGGVEIVGLNITFLGRMTLLGNECLIGQEIIKRLKVTFDHGNQMILEL